MPILMITLSLYLFRDLCILGICTLLKMTFGTTNPLRKTPLLVLTPSENLIYRGGVDIKWNSPTLSPFMRRIDPFIF